MKRVVLVICLLTAIAVGAFLASHRPGAQASPDVTITVNRVDDTDYRDAYLTLREALKLATGDLSVEYLHEGECDQVSTAQWVEWPLDECVLVGPPPGGSSPDTIVFDTSVFPPGSPATIALTSTLPTLGTGGNDIISGSSAGVIVSGVSKAFDCISITSNGNVIKGLQIRNCHVGVTITAGAQYNTIGGTTASERNVISGNSRGVDILDSGTSGNTVKGNYIGTDASGTGALPNGTGVTIKAGAEGNTVGGTTAGERNVISGSDIAGVFISDDPTSGNTVKGNYIGTDATGTSALGNTWGVEIVSVGQANTVGGTTAGERNVISGNGTGVEIWASTGPNTVEGNYIGTDASGSGALPNDTGVKIWSRAYDNTIGGTAAGQGNVIAYNTEDGVYVNGVETTGNTIRGNSIHSNGDKGIENHDGGNTELAVPTITGFGSVLGTGCADCTIDIYSDDEDEGRVYEGSTTASGAGNWSFSGSLDGPNITATATDADGNTSEFSAPVALPEPTPTPSPTSSPTPSPTPTATPTGTPTPGTTRTLVWGPGWHNAAWSGASTPEEAFACAGDNYAAAYRLVSGGWERYFPGRSEISNMTDLEQYDAFPILVTGDVTCEMVVTDPAGTQRTLEWGVGWQNEVWTGADGTTPQDAFACADGSYAAAYRLVGGGWERYFPGRPDISSMGPLNKYDAFLILVTAPVNCSMAIAP
jgi:hypothetical protein